MAPSSLRHYIQALIGFQPSKLAFSSGLRKALVMVVLLAAAVATGQIYVGFMLVIGAFSLGFIDQGGSYLPRLRAMLIGCLAIGAAAAIGALTAPFVWLFVLLMALAGFLGGMLVAIGPAALVIGLQIVFALALSSNFHLSPSMALETGALLIVGGLLQMAVALAPWPFTRCRYEREAVANAYQALASLAEQPSDTERGLHASEALAQGRRTLVDSAPPFGASPARKTFQALLDMGWGIAQELIALAELREHLPAQQEPAKQHLDELTGAASALLSALSAGLKANRSPAGLEEPQQRVERALEALRCDQSGSSTASVVERELLAATLERAEALSQETRSALAICSEWIQTGANHAPAAGWPGPSVLQPQDAPATLRANLTPDSMIFRHALRLSAALIVAAILYKTLPVQRGYWIPLTVALVLRPDFTTTLTRGLVLGVGTLLGAALADLLIAVVQPGTWVLVLFVAVLAFTALSVFQASFALYIVLLTGYIVSLVELAGTPPLVAAEARAIDVLIGAALAMVAMLLWPAWERGQVPSHLAGLLETEARYITLILNGYLDPKTLDPARARHCWLQARLARSNAEASVQRSLAEPARFRTDARVAQGVLSHDINLFSVTQALEAVFWHTRPDHPLPFPRRFIDDLQTAAHALSHALRSGTRVEGWPDLEAARRALVDWMETSPDREDRARLIFVVAEVERLITNFCSIHQLLAER